MNRLALAAGIIGLLLLCLLCPWCRAPAIEDNVRRAALACADDVGLVSDQVSVSGRDVMLTGPIASPEARGRVVECIQAFEGTRVVDDRLQLLRAGSLEFFTEYNTVTVRGVVPTQSDRATIIDQAVALWGGDNVSHDLEVDASRTIGGWPDDDFAGFLAALHHSRRDLDIELTGGQATVTGTVLSELAKSRVLGAAAALLPGFEIVDRLTVREPASDREALQSNLDNLLVGRIVEFDTDSAELTATGRATLDEVIGVLERLPGRIEISGHTDATGSPEHNLELSRQRAESVKAYLVSKGIDGDRCETVGYGQHRPIATNATDEGRQMNRRTEFHALKEN